VTDRNDGRACRSTKRLLPLFVGGEITAREQRGLEEHLLGCEACASYEEALRGDRERLAEVGRAQEREAALPAAIADGDAFWASLQGAIAQADPRLARTTPVPGERRARILSLGTMLRGAVAAAAVLLAVYVYGPWSAPGTGPAGGIRTDIPVGVAAPGFSQPDGVIPVRSPAADTVAPAGRPGVEYPLDGWRKPAEDGEVLSF
jgi:anti-sigma factor RsiW